jgi:hypothetical protein
LCLRNCYALCNFLHHNRAARLCQVKKDIARARQAIIVALMTAAAISFLPANSIGKPVCRSHYPLLLPAPGG